MGYREGEIILGGLVFTIVRFIEDCLNFQGFTVEDCLARGNSS